MLHTQRGKFLALEDSYHGNSLAAISVASTEDRESLPNFLRGCEKIRAPLDERALSKMEARLKCRDVAAFIMEPVSINLGVVMPERAAIAELQRLCRRTGTLLIMDEVACGVGRTGKLFASEHFPIEPDILCLRSTDGLMGCDWGQFAVTEKFDSVSFRVDRAPCQTRFLLQRRM